MRLVAVLDVKDRVVVRGVGGRRDEYRPLVTPLTPSCQPLDVAEAIRVRFGLDELYLADLDAIAGAAPALAFYEQLGQRGFRLWVDAGIREAADAEPLAQSGVTTLVAGLETLAGPRQLAELSERHGQALLFSLDLKNGRPLTSSAEWPADPWHIAQAAIALGVRRLLLLDLARVGEGRGTGTEELCAQIVQAHPDVEVSTGGGVRGREDLDRLERAGVAAVLLASVLHDVSAAQVCFAR